MGLGDVSGFGDWDLWALSFGGLGLKGPKDQGLGFRVPQNLHIWNVCGDEHAANL